MILRYGLIALGLYVLIIAISRAAIVQAVLGSVLILVGISLIQAQRVAKRWQAEADRTLAKGGSARR